MWLIAGQPGLTGLIDGTNQAFTANVSLNDSATVYINGLAILPATVVENGYTLTGQTVTFAETPVPGDTVAIFQPDAPTNVFTTNYVGPYPQSGSTQIYAPAITGNLQAPVGSISPPTFAGWTPPTGAPPCPSSP